MPFFREDGPKLLVRCRFVERTKLIAYYTGFEAPVGGTCTRASWRRSITSLISAVPSSLHHGIANVDFCSIPGRAKECKLYTDKSDASMICNRKDSRLCGGLHYAEMCPACPAEHLNWTWSSSRFVGRTNTEQLRGVFIGYNALRGDRIK
jgi:hypothetical protein